MRSAEEEEVLVAHMAFYEAFEHHDFARMDAVWSRRDDITVVHPGWELLRGRTEVMSSWRALLSERGTTVSSLPDPKVYLTGDMAVVVCTEVFGDVELMATNVFVREDGAWKMVHHQGARLVNRYNPIPSIAPPTSTRAPKASPPVPRPPTSSPPAIHRRAIDAIEKRSEQMFPEDRGAANERKVDQSPNAAEAAFAYDALRISESHHRALHDNMLSGVFTLTEKGLIETANPAALRMFGYAQDEVLARPFDLLFASPETATEALLQTMNGIVSEQRGRRKNGEAFPFELRLFRLQSLRGSGYGAIVQDVSQRYEVERIKGEIVSIVSHELRTPLTAIRGAIGLLVGGVLGELAKEPMEVLTIAERNTVRLITLVNDILDMDRLQQGKMTLKISEVTAEQLILRSIEAVRSFADEEGVSLDVTSTGGTLTGDEDRLVQVIVNLLSNAIKFSPVDSRVQIGSTVEESAIVFRVADQGRGVPPSRRKRIFEHFYQVEASDAREKGGTGLGLAICRALVEQHGGTIGVDGSDGPGAVFWFRIPI